MRKSLLISGVVITSLALSACGSTSSPTAKKAALKQYVGSLGSAPNTQIHLTVSASGSGVTAKATSILKAVSLDLNASNPSGAPLSQAKGTASIEFIFNTGSTAFLDVRDVDQNIYLKIDASALASIPGTNISASQAAAAQAFIGGKWFELPKSLLTKLVHKTRVPKAQVATDQRVEAKVLDAIANLIVHAPYKTLSNGFSETGTLKSLVTGLGPTISQFSHSASASTAAPKGSYTLVLTTSGSNITGASISITAPNKSKGGTTTGSLTAKVAHGDVKVVAPSGATVITPGLLATLGLGSALGGG